MNQNELSFFKGNKSSINERKNKDFKLEKLKFYTKLNAFFLFFIILFN